MAHGATRGERRRLPRYQPGSGEPWRLNTNFRPETADKLLALCNATGLSGAGFLDKLVERIEIDPQTGAPVGWNAPIQEALEIAS